MSEREIDQELVVRVQQGDKKAFDMLVMKYQLRVSKLVSRFLRNQSDVPDVVQEAFIKAYRALPNFRGESAFYTWLYRIAVNLCKDHFRKKRVPMVSLHDYYTTPSGDRVYVTDRVADEGARSDEAMAAARNEEMVRMMARAGFKSIFLGIESASKKNLKAAHKGDIVNASRTAVELCHKYGIMVVGGMIFGFPDDEEADIMENYRFLKSIDADTSYCQILTPYPKTGIRQHLLDEGLVTNPDDFSTYNGMWANVCTRHLGAEQLQYLVWYHRQTIMGWWEPSQQVRTQGRLWTGIWIYFFRPFLKVVLGRRLKRIGWEGRYERDMARLKGVNRFPDLDD